MNPVNVAMHVGAGMTVLALGFFCFSMGWIGGGDAKLAAATVLWLGFDQMFTYLLLASMFGGALTLLLLQFRQWPLPSLLNRQEWVHRLHERNAGIPYGIALSAAALLVYPESPFMRTIGI
jgi:prepilin peptidase CpaA